MQTPLSGNTVCFPMNLFVFMDFLHRFTEQNLLMNNIIWILLKLFWFIRFLLMLFPVLHMMDSGFIVQKSVGGRLQTISEGFSSLGTFAATRLSYLIWDHIFRLWHTAALHQTQFHCLERLWRWLSFTFPDSFTAATAAETPPWWVKMKSVRIPWTRPSERFTVTSGLLNSDAASSQPLRNTDSHGFSHLILTIWSRLYFFISPVFVQLLNLSRVSKRLSSVKSQRSEISEVSLRGGGLWSQSVT